MAKRNQILPSIEVVEKKTWLTILDLEVYAGFADDVQRELRTKGTDHAVLPFSRIKGNIRYKKSDVDEFIEKHSTKRQNIAS